MGVADVLTPFEEVKESVSVDDKGRLGLGKEFAGKKYRVARNAEGDILLTPVVLVPERDMWLYRNPETLAEYQRSMAEAAAGQATVGEDFTQYAREEK